MYWSWTRICDDFREGIKIFISITIYISVLKKLTFHKLNWLEYLTIGLGLWFLIYPEPYEILFIILLFIPILGLILNGLTGRPSIASLVKISKNDEGKDKYDVADFIDFAGWVLFLRVLIDYEFESFKSILIPCTIGFIIMLIVLFSTHKQIESSNKSKIWIYFSLILNVFVFSYAGTYGVNCIFDNSKPIIYDARVVSKSISTSSKGRKTYYLEVTPWGHHFDKEEISVPERKYCKINIGEKVKIDLKKGLFNIPWYYIE